MVGGLPISGTTGPLSFTFDPNDPFTVYTPVAKSTDGGHIWASMPTPAGGQRQVGLDPSRHELYAVGSGGVYRSGDGGWFAYPNCRATSVKFENPLRRQTTIRRSLGSRSARKSSHTRFSSASL